MLGMIIGALVVLYNESKNELQATQKPEPCHCLTYEEISAYTAFYEVYLDSANYAPKKQRPRYQDSIQKYSDILKIQQ